MVKGVKYIAERKLRYAEKDSNQKKNFTIRISMPFVVRQSMVNFPLDGEMFACQIEVENLNESYPFVYGADGIQAINLASNLEPFIKRLQEKYDIFWESGDPYFES